MFKIAGKVTHASILCAATIAIGVSASAAQEVNFKGKTITVLVGSEVGGGTDASARLVAPFLTKYLPGQPAVVVQNLPGAGGIKALNFFSQRAAPDGLTLVNGSISMLDPITSGGVNAQYDTKSLKFIGGIGRGGGAIFATKDAVERLNDKSKRPVIIGSALAVPRSIMQPALWAIEYLGWNAKWIVGYHGTNDVMLALDRGEIDMTSTGNLFQIKDRLNNGQLKLVVQSGYLSDGKLLSRKDYGDTPLFPDQIKGKVTEPVAKKAYEYWEALNNGDKWVALPPATPDNIVAVFKEAFAKISQDPEFLEKGEKISDGFVPMTSGDVATIARTLADTPPESLNYAKTLMRKQGIQVE
jgi:tripartite-type tricarboxylate transporter receptor subunit TctC